MFNRNAHYGRRVIAFEEDNRDFILACFFLPGDLVEILAKKKHA
jgi:hypothetical protein